MPFAEYNKFKTVRPLACLSTAQAQAMCRNCGNFTVIQLKCCGMDGACDGLGCADLSTTELRPCSFWQQRTNPVVCSHPQGLTDHSIAWLLWCQKQSVQSFGCSIPCMDKHHQSLGQSCILQCLNVSVRGCKAKSRFSQTGLRACTCPR